MSWYRLSLTAQLVLALYTQVVEWVDLFPWNDLSSGNGQEKLDVAIAAAQIGLIYGTWKRSPRLAILGSVLYGFWLVLQLYSWWWPYLRRREPNSVPAIYQRYFARTYKVLPARGNRIVPDASHTALQVFILAAMVATAKAAREIRPDTRSA